jgi:hypothetical protein
MTKHLVVLHHGLFGRAQDMENLLTFLRDSYPETELVFLNCELSQRLESYQGVDISGDRCVQEVNEFLNKVPDCEAISFVSYSLGGLIVRYAIGKLYKQKLFEKLQPINFVTFASPHLGSKRPPLSGYNRFYNGYVKTLFTRVGKQLTLKDKFVEGKPILEVLADPNYDFFRGLQAFKQRILFANMMNDRSVRFTTASIRPRTMYKLYHPKCPDPSYPCIVEPDLQNPVKPLTGWAKFKHLAFWYIFVPIFVPIGYFISTILIAIVALLAKMRQRNLETDNDWVSMTGTQPRAMESQDTLIGLQDKFDQEDQEEVMDEWDEETTLGKCRDRQRMQMILNLNKLGWKKVDCCFNLFNAHARIIRRTKLEENPPRDAFNYLVDKLFLLE